MFAILRGEEFVANYVNDGLSAIAVEQREGKRDAEELVGADAGVVGGRG